MDEINVQKDYLVFQLRLFIKLFAETTLAFIWLSSKASSLTSFTYCFPIYHIWISVDVLTGSSSEVPFWVDSVLTTPYTQLWAVQTKQCNYLSISTSFLKINTSGQSSRIQNLTISVTWVKQKVIWSLNELKNWGFGVVGEQIPDYNEGNFVH